MEIARNYGKGAETVACGEKGAEREAALEVALGQVMSRPSTIGMRLFV